MTEEMVLMDIDEVCETAAFFMRPAVSQNLGDKQTYISLLLTDEEVAKATESLTQYRILIEAFQHLIRMQAHDIGGGIIARWANVDEYYRWMVEPRKRIDSGKFHGWEWVFVCEAL